MSEESVLRSRRLAVLRDLEDAELALSRAAGKMADLGCPTGSVHHVRERVGRERERWVAAQELELPSRAVS